jgi:cytochrome c-type biogenesis protein CcmE
VAAPVLGLVAVTGDMTLAIAVAALDDASLVALLGNVALLTAVVASTTSTASTSTRGRRLEAVGLVVAGSPLAKAEKIRAEMERDGIDGLIKEKR